MALWDKLKQRSQDMNVQLKTKASQFKNKDFADASMAMCALIAAADGSIDSSERSKVAGLISANDVLSMFPASDLRERFDHYCDRLSSDYDFGKIEAVQSIVKLRSEPDQARAVIQIGIIIGGADGNFDAHERGAISDACFAVGFSASEFDI
jgi:tellurite resistance protein TerB